MSLNLALIRVALWLAVLCMSGCASPGGAIPDVPIPTAAILGVTTAPGVESASSVSAMTRELEELMQFKGGFKILRSGDAGHKLNAVTPESFETLRQNYASNGQLTGIDLRALRAANLPVKSALIARVEKNVVRQAAPKRIAMRNNVGQVLSDRKRIVKSTVREMQVRASMINVSSGRVVWSKSYRATPASESSYVHYTGSSFSGSLAASFANTMSNGLRVPASPMPPSNQLTLRSLLREIVQNVPRH